MGRTRIGLTRGQADIIPLDHVLKRYEVVLFIIIFHARKFPGIPVVGFADGRSAGFRARNADWPMRENGAAAAQ